MSVLRFRTSVWFSVLLSFILFTQVIQAQEGTEPAAQPQAAEGNSQPAAADAGKPETSEKSPPPADDVFDMQSYLNYYQHRIRFRFGLGFSEVSPGILNEAGPTWFTNSLYRSGFDPEVPFAFPVKTPASVPAMPVHTELSYGWKNRLEVSLLRHSNVSKYGRADPTSVNFITPSTDRYYMAYFEGVRLLRYEETSHILRGSYLFPLTERIMVGPMGGLSDYLERNEISYGSYSVTKHTTADPNMKTWSMGGSASADYRMKGYLAGGLVKFNPFNWLELRGSLELVSRSGSFELGGNQILSRESAETPGGAVFGLLIPIYRGDTEDTGFITQLEATFRFCRFSVDTGIIYSDYKRQYKSYWGDTIALGNINRQDYSARSSGLLLGFSEMAGRFKHSSAEFYIRPGVSIHFE